MSTKTNTIKTGSNTTKVLPILYYVLGLDLDKWLSEFDMEYDESKHSDIKYVFVEYQKLINNLKIYLTNTELPVRRPVKDQKEVILEEEISKSIDIEKVSKQYSQIFEEEGDTLSENTESIYHNIPNIPKESVFGYGMKNAGEFLSPFEIYKQLEGYKIILKKLEIMKDRENLITYNLHRATGVRYIVVRGYWIDFATGKKIRKFSTNLGAEEKVLEHGKIPNRLLLNARNEISQMMLSTYRMEYGK